MTTPPPLDWDAILAGEPTTDDTPVPRPKPSEGAIPPTSDTAAQAERARVLRHPDIAAKLLEPPLNYNRPEQWNGYVPPETWQGKHNNAPQRVALLAIITAAIEADLEIGAGP